MTTTRESLEAMQRADWLRAKRPGSSMHPSWFDVAALQEAARRLQEESLKNPPPDWLVEQRRQEAAAYEAELAAAQASDPSDEPAA